MTSDMGMIVYNHLEEMEEIYNKIPEGKRFEFCEKVAEHLENDILSDVIKEAIEEMYDDADPPYGVDDSD